MITDIQLETFRWLAECLEKEHQLPPVLSIAEHFDIYPNAANDRLKALERAGMIERNKFNRWKLCSEIKVKTFTREKNK